MGPFFFTDTVRRYEFFEDTCVVVRMAKWKIGEADVHGTRTGVNESI